MCTTQKKYQFNKYIVCACGTKKRQLKIIHNSFRKEEHAVLIVAHCKKTKQEEKTMRPKVNLNNNFPHIQQKNQIDATRECRYKNAGDNVERSMLECVQVFGGFGEMHKTIPQVLLCEKRIASG